VLNVEDSDIKDHKNFVENVLIKLKWMLIKNICKILKEKKLKKEQIKNIDRKLKWEVSKFPIFIDNRGTGERDLAKLLKDMHLAVEIRHVDSGDIVFGDVGIERKTVNDLVNSVIGQNRHFWEQLDVLKNTYKKPFVLLEGQLNYKDAWISGVFFSIIYGWGIPVIPTFNLQDSALAIKRLFIKYGSGKSKAYPPSAVRKADSPEKIRWMMLQCIKKVGPVTAKKILNEMPMLFGTDYNSVAFKQKLKKVKGLGENQRILLETIFNSGLK